MSGLWRLATPEVNAAASLPPVASARPPLVAMSSAQELRPAERTSTGANAEDADQVFVEEDRTRFFPPGTDLSSVTFDSTSPVVHCGWLYKLSVRRKVAKIFPNVGRHFNNWKKRWFILHENGNLHYYKDQDRPDVDESTAAAASPTERTSLTGTLLSSFFAPVPPPPTGSPPPVRLLLRGSLVLTGRSIAVPHAYSPVPFVLSIQLENADKDELLVRGEGRDVYEDWLFETNDCIQRLLKVGSWGDGRGEHGGKALNDLAFYVKRRLSLERNLVGASGGGADDDEEDMDEGEGEGAEDAPPGGGGISSYLASLVGGGAAASKKHEPGREAVTWIGAPQKKLKYLAGDLSAMIDKLGGVYDPTTPPPPEQGEGFVVVDEHVTVPNKERGMASGIPAPRLNIVCLVVGTYGDVTPFVAMAKKLKEMGHFVRIATHAEFREKVMNEGILFYPLAGNSQKLSQYMVKTHGKLMPNLFDANDIKLHAEDLPEKLTMLEEICFSTWPACTAPDPADPSHAPFVADAIISNPVTYGHSHCAEALGIPLHMFFPQPWTPTKAFPHVFSQMRMDKGWSLDNYLSYYFVDEFLWLGTESFVNKFREEVLSLPMLRRGELGGHRLNTLRVPFCYQFSPKLVPKPKDWPSHADVVGNFFAAGLSPAPPIAPKLDAFIAEDPSNLPVFIGFGSMAVESPEPLLKLIVAAVKKTNTRVILQNGYTKWGETYDKIQADAAGGESTKLFGDSRKLFHFLDGCPHDWLFTKIAAVVHHGGAGTVAAGLRAGKPTLVCPFFGDQFFWGELVYRAGVGPACIPSTEITVNNFAAALEALKSPGMRTAAEDMALAFSKEDGVGNGIAAFHKHLPVEDMVCDVSLFLPEAQQKNNARTLVACRWCSECQFKMSAEVDSVVHAPGTGREHHIRTKYAPIDWGTSDGPTNALDGFAQGVAGMGQEMVSAIAGLLIEPIKGGRRNGVAGGLNGVVEGLKGLVLRPLRGGLIFVDKTGAGIAAHIERERYAAKNQTRPYRRFVIYDKLFEIGQRIERGAFGWRDHPMIGSDKEPSESHKAESAAGATGGGASSSAAFAPQVPTQRQSDIIKAFDIAQECRIVFSNSERSRLDGVTFAKADMMRSLSSVIAETKQKGAASSPTEKKGQRNSIAGGGVEGAQSSETISNLIDNYFGIKGGKMQFSEFVGQFLFANTSAVDERVTTQKERRGSHV